MSLRRAAQRRSLDSQRTKTSDRLASEWFGRHEVHHRVARLLRWSSQVLSAGQSRAFRSRAWQRKTHARRAAASVGVGWAGRCVHRGGLHSRAAARSSVPAVAASGIVFGPGSLHRLVPCSFEQSGAFNSRARLARRAGNDHSGPAIGRHRAAWGCSKHPGSLARLALA